MELKFLVFVFLIVFLAALECIETRRSSGVFGRSSGGGSRTSAAYRIHRPSRPRPRPPLGPRPRPPPGPRPHPGPRPTPRPTPRPRPRPFTTARPPRPTTESPYRTFATVPPPRYTAGTHQTPVHTTPAPYHGHGNGSTGVHPPGSIGTGPSVPTHPTPPPSHNREFPNQGNYSVGTGLSPPAPGWNISVSNSKPPGTLPPAPVQPTHYPTQATHTGGSVSGQGYQVPNQPTSLDSPYPSHNSTNGKINPVETHVIHHLPPSPVQTVVVVPGQTGNQKTTEDILTEVLIHAGANAIVHSVLSPTHHHHHHNDNPKNNGAPPQGQSTVTTTNTHITNYNYYDQNPGSTGNVAGGSNPASNGGNNYPNSGNSGNYSNAGSPGGSQIPTNGQSHPNQNSGNGQVNNGYITIFDDELLNITEKLFSLDENNASRYISLNLQKQVEANNTSNITDQSPQPLFSIQPEAYSIPTVRAIRSVYQAADSIENKTREDSRREEALLVDLILNTNVMTAAMNFLAQKGLIKNDYYPQRDMLMNLWFTAYDGSSSGFKRIFQGEIFEGILWGIQDWIAFDFYEKSGRANYFSYVTKTDLGKSSPNTAILKTNFQMNGSTKTRSALFVGVSPELQMALYTICYHTRRDNYCDVSLGGTRVRIYTHAGRYFGKDLINVAFPIL